LLRKKLIRILKEKVQTQTENEILDFEIDTGNGKVYLNYR